MTAQNENDVDANWQALASFVDHCGISRDRGDRCRFDALVTFRSDRNADERARVYISFRDDEVSAVRFGETGQLNPVFVHTEFRVTSSTFKFENNELQILGTSPKVGRYEVRILPS
ncbi:MAG: hypothetical protein ACRECY_16250 [Phyllobacterium sp.]